MIRRWLIRVPCLLALALVVGVWMMSYFNSLDLGKWSGGHPYSVGAVQGLGYMDKAETFSISDTPLRFHLNSVVIASVWGNPGLTMGFGVSRWPGDPDSWMIIFPLWLPTLLLVGLNWFVWRKTRAKYNGRGFPVELTKKAEG